ncbi:MAG: hypothetical protein ACI9DF_005587 [Verrucomicrobiales bacterium]|jgi:hypothetical protein
MIFRLIPDVLVARHSNGENLARQLAIGMASHMAPTISPRDPCGLGLMSGDAPSL